MNKEKEQKLREIHEMLKDKWGAPESFETWVKQTEEIQEESYQDFKDFWFGVLMLILVFCGLSQGLLGDYTHGLMPVAIYVLQNVIIE